MASLFATALKRALRPPHQGAPHGWSFLRYRRWRSLSVDGRCRGTGERRGDLGDVAIAVIGKGIRAAGWINHCSRIVAIVIGVGRDEIQPTGIDHSGGRQHTVVTWSSFSLHSDRCAKSRCPAHQRCISWSGRGRWSLPVRCPDRRRSMTVLRPSGSLMISCRPATSCCTLLVCPAASVNATIRPASS